MAGCYIVGVLWRLLQSSTGILSTDRTLAACTPRPKFGLILAKVFGSLLNIFKCFEPCSFEPNRKLCPIHCSVESFLNTYRLSGSPPKINPRKQCGFELWGSGSESGVERILPLGHSCNMINMIRKTAKKNTNSQNSPDSTRIQLQCPHEINKTQP